MNVQDKIILVTGGANGIGKALCERFHAGGAAKVIAANLDFTNAEKVAESVGGADGKILIDYSFSLLTVCVKILTKLWLK